MSCQWKQYVIIQNYQKMKSKYQTTRPSIASHSFLMHRRAHKRCIMMENRTKITNFNQLHPLYSLGANSNHWEANRRSHNAMSSRNGQLQKRGNELPNRRPWKKKALWVGGGAKDSLATICSLSICPHYFFQPGYYSNTVTLLFTNIY